MLKSWLIWINISLAALGASLLLAAIGITLVRESDIATFEGPIPERSLPKSDFQLEKKMYDTLSGGALELQFSPLSIRLPDLAKSLVYYGKNGRPDAQLQAPALHFSFTGNKTPFSIPPGERAYIKYDAAQNPPQYVLSPSNAETSLWIEATAEGNKAIITVGMADEKGGPITEPAAHAQFSLVEKEVARVPNAANTWEIARLRVDGTLLARQKARWYAVDKFLEKHGGPEYASIIGKQRIDFGEGDKQYSVYIDPATVIAWDGDRWKAVEPGPETLPYPLLTIKKMDERVMTFELWDVEGKNKVLINLLKSSEVAAPQTLQKTFKFVGARTRSQFIFEINNERFLLSPQDWLLFTDNRWKKLVTPEDIDAYVERKITGPLFVFDGVEKKDEGQVMQGTLFNSTRTDGQPIEIPMQQKAKEPSPKAPVRIEPRKEAAEGNNLPSPEIMREQYAEEKA